MKRPYDAVLCELASYPVARALTPEAPEMQTV